MSLICIYPADCTDFSNNGLGVVTPTSCTVTETLNGEWELTLEHEIDERCKWMRLSEGCILRAPVPAAMTPRVGLVTQQYLRHFRLCGKRVSHRNAKLFVV